MHGDMKAILANAPIAFGSPWLCWRGLSMSQVEGINDTFAISFDSKDIQF